MRAVLSLLFLCCLVCAAQAGVGSSSGADFLRLGGGARPLALGDAFTGVADDASAVFYNPAGLSQINYPEALTMYNSYFADMKQQLAAVVVPTGYGVWGIGYSALGSGDIQGYNSTGAVTSTFNTGSSSLGLSFSRHLNPELAWGVGLKTVAEKLADNSASAVALDAGLHYRFNQNINLGLAVLNYGSGLKFITDNTPLPTAYRLGGTYLAKVFNDDVMVASDLVAYPEATKLNVGVEYKLRDLLAIRVGSAGGGLRAGLGLTANLLAIDYSYRSQADLGAAHQLSLSLLFGAPELAKKRVLEEMANVKAYLKENKYSDAIISAEKVLDLDPHNEEAPLLLKKAQLELENTALNRVFSQKAGEIKRSVGEILTSGRGFMDQGKYLEALGEFSNALKLDSSNRETLKLQSEAQFKMESQLIKESQTEAKQYLGEALKLVVTGQYSEALGQVDQALAKDPKNKEALALKKKLQLIQSIEKK